MGRDSSRRRRVFSIGALVAVVAAAGVTLWIVNRDQPWEGLSGACAEAHEGHATSMWDPTMADEMVDAGCPWPYEPFVPEEAEGDAPADDPSLDAPFEAHRYAEVWTAISSTDVGVCRIAARTDDAVPDRAFGFAYEVGPGGCPDGRPTGAVVVDEFATEGGRDAAARRAADAGPALVLGRWAISLEGDADAVGPELEALGARPVR